LCKKKQRPSLITKTQYHDDVRIVMATPFDAPTLVHVIASNLIRQSTKIHPIRELVPISLIFASIIWRKKYMYIQD